MPIRIWFEEFEAIVTTHFFNGRNGVLLWHVLRWQNYAIEEQGFVKGDACHLSRRTVRLSYRCKLLDCFQVHWVRTKRKIRLSFTRREAWADYTKSTGVHLLWFKICKHEHLSPLFQIDACAKFVFQILNLLVFTYPHVS